MFVDTHTHLYAEAFDEDREVVLARAREAGVSHFFLPAIDSAYTGRMRDLKARYPSEVYMMSGLHPTHVDERWETELAHVEKELDTGHYVAVGEIGIDLYWDRSRLDLQREAFRIQIGWAKARGLPIVIHCRDAFDEIFEILESEKGPGLFGIFHCFTGTLDQAKKAIGYGMKLGIGGVVTFKNGKIDRFLHEIPLEHLVLETDAPYLAPKPFRGKRNEPAYLLQVAGRLSELYGKQPEEIASVTTETAGKLFGVDLDQKQSG